MKRFVTKQMTIRTLMLLGLLTMLQLPLAAQQLEWSANVFGFADNREYAKSDRYSQSILGIRFSPEIGLLTDSIHRLRIGVNMLHEFGSLKGLDKVNPVIYYNYRDKGFDFYIGMFPRHELLADYPKAVLNDTLMYYRPNVEGMLLRYANSHVMQQLWIDWTSRQTEHEREQFMVGTSGKFKAGNFYFSDFATLYHDAGPMIDDPTRTLRDNAAVNVNLGADLGRKTFLDSLDIQAGLLLSLNRLRELSGWQTAKGFMAQVHAEYHRFFIHDTFYKGQEHGIAYGDRFYTAKQYNRLELGWTPLRFKNLEGKFIASFHFTPGAVDNQQQFLLRYFIGKSYQLKN